MQFVVMVNHQVKLMFRNRLAVLVTIAVPLLLAFLFSFSQGDSQAGLNADIRNNPTSNKEHFNITVVDQSLSNREKSYDNATARLIGFLVMFIWFVVIQGLRTLIDERENTMLGRLLSTPIGYTKYLLSKMTATYLFCSVHIIAILVAGKYLLKISIVDNAWAVGILFAGYVFTLISMTMLVIPFMKNQKQFTSSASIMIAVTGMLGGCFFSMDTAPEFMRILSGFTPEAWAIQALDAVIFHYQPIHSVSESLGTFAGIGILCSLAGFMAMNRAIKVLKG